MARSTVSGVTAAVLLVITACGSQSAASSLDVLWQLRSADTIERTGRLYGHGQGVGGLAWPSETPCRIMTPPPPVAGDIGELLVWEAIVQHELRHCREGAFH